MTIHELPEQWRAEAKQLRDRYGDAARAKICEELANDLEKALRESLFEALTPAEAALESGYSVKQVKRMLREKKIPNVASQRKPLILRMHLPRKPGHAAVVPETVSAAECRDQVARAVASGE